jgi:hypothetical protein
MIDSYLYLTPILVLGVIALLGFVGCDVVFGLHHVDYIPAPTGFTAVPGDGRVDLSWDPYDKATEYNLKRGTTSGVYSITFNITAPATTYADLAVTNGTDYFYALTATVPAGGSDTSDEVDATPQASPTLQSFVTSFTPGTLRNQLTGWAGMAVQIGPSPVTIKALGRLFIPGNTAMHNLKIVDAVSSVDIAAVSIMVASGTVGEFAYVDLASPVKLAAGATCYIVSEELAGGDHVYLQDTTVQTSSVATVTSAVTGTAQGVYTPTDAAGHTFGPVDFKY